MVFTDEFVGGEIRLVSGQMPDTGVPVWLVDCPDLFDRPGGPYQDPFGGDWPDNLQRFALLSRVAVRLALGTLDVMWRPDVVHAHDWHTGLIPLLLGRVRGRRPATLFTIHNMAYQGQFGIESLADLGLPTKVFTPAGIEFYGGVSLLKAGIRYADHVNTVSPTYADEIKTSDEGCGFDGLLRERADALSGILNGVDYRCWDPVNDGHLPATYSNFDVSGKRICKGQLQRELGLTESPDTPLIAYISRFTHQKMTDIVADVTPALLEKNLQLAMLGEGEPALEHRLRELAQLGSGRLAIRVGYEEPLAHRLQAGADILLHPSRFEPCGLSQLYALRYGTLPVVRSVGGLADTVVDADEDGALCDRATGFVFQKAEPTAMLDAVDRALALYAQPLVWRRMQRRAMSRNFGWEASAKEYLSLYNQLVPLATPASPDRDQSALPGHTSRNHQGISRQHYDQTTHTTTAMARGGK